MARSKLEGGLLTYDQAAGCLAVGRTTMYDLVARGELPAVKIGQTKDLGPLQNL